MPGFAVTAGVTDPATQMYIVGLEVGPRRPTAPVAGSNAVPPTGLFVARRQIAEAALNEIGMVEPGSACILVSCVGSVKLMITNALALPLTCHSPAFTAVGKIVVGTPLMTVPKFRSRSVEIVIPTVTTTASADTDAPACAAARPGKPTHIANSRAFLTEPPAAPSHGPRPPSARPSDRDHRAR